MNRLLVIAWKELLQLRRDRLTLAMMIALPLLQLMLFGYAIDNDVRHIPMVVFDQDRRAASRDLARRLEATGSYDRIGEVAGYDEIGAAMRAGRAKVALVVPAGFARARAAGRTARVQLVVDGSDPQSVASATTTAAALAAGPSPLAIEPTTWFNPELKTSVFIVPGLVGVILTMTMVMLTAMAVVRERERGTLEQLIVSPVTNLELIVGKIAPYVVMGYVQMSLILTAAHVLFGVHMVGSLALLYALAFVFIAANLALGLFFSTIARTQQQAMQMSFFFLLPNILLSGFMFPFEGMPRPARWLAEGLPLTHFHRVVRGIVLKGADLADLAPDLLAMGAIVLVLVALTSRRFKKRLD